LPTRPTTQGTSPMRASPCLDRCSHRGLSFCPVIRLLSAPDFYA
jgi:hypothetical protein